MALSSNYADFIQQSLLWHQQQKLTLITWADPKSPSQCQVNDIVDGTVQWQPVLQQPKADFSNVEQALELTLHPDIITFYQTYFGAGLAAEHPKGKLALLMVWNNDDLNRLQENIIGHILMKRRLKQQETVFFATTEDDDILLSVLNSTGEVFLERVGQEVTEKLAANLAEFFTQLQPCAYEGL
ncbi:SecY-interacting protein [Rheinheimera sp. WS51]|uniref:SecY-interacting protein n=1 Tax=Rheinheimera sp. WS51 TaxID=3425886 RepID=UPI003D8BC0CE